MKRVGSRYRKIGFPLFNSLLTEDLAGLFYDVVHVMLARLFLFLYFHVFSLISFGNEKKRLSLQHETDAKDIAFNLLMYREHRDVVAVQHSFLSLCRSEYEWGGD